MQKLEEKRREREGGRREEGREKQREGGRVRE